jgi:phage terminase large subunit
MSLFAVNHELYEANSDANYRVFVNQGGTSSGKTYCIMQKLIEISLQEPRCVITVAGQDLPNLKVGALRDTENIIDRSPFLANWFSMNRSESYFRGKNGALIEFKSYDSAQDAKNGKRDYLFVNEANGITFEVYWQLAIRTRKKIYIDYNPSARFWVHDQLLGKEDTKLIISDHRGNEFLTEDEHAKIEAIEDPDWHMVYARGLTGKLTGLVLKKWDIVDKMPEPDTWRMSVYGLDWGFVNDPTALEHLVLAHGEL